MRATIVPALFFALLATSAALPKPVDSDEFCAGQIMRRVEAESDKAYYGNVAVECSEATPESVLETVKAETGA